MRIRIGNVVLLSFVACSPAVFAKAVPKDDPAYLRGHHAGVESMTVQAGITDAFIAIRDGVSSCYVDHENPLLWPSTIGIIAQGSVNRRIKVALSDDKTSGYVMYGVKAFWYAPAFQFDLRQTVHGVDVTYYYDNDNRMQRSAFLNAKAWLDGNASACADAR